MAQLFFITCIILSACDTYTKSPLGHPIVTFYYDLFKQDSLVKKNAVVIKSIEADTNLITIAGFEKEDIVFKQKITDYGILRSSNGSEYYLTHFFNARSSIESFLPTKKAVFANSVTSLFKEKYYPFGNIDSLNIIYFEESIPAYTYTSTYFSKSLNTFILYYNSRDNYYYKLSAISGLQINIGDLLNLEDDILKDTTFFAKFLIDKLPKKPLPPNIDE